jgi:hypothetical protein
MLAQAYSLKQVWTSLEWDHIRRQASHSQYEARSVAAVNLSLQEAAVEEAQWLLLQEKLGLRWEQTLEEV